MSPQELYFFETNRLNALGERLHAGYIQASPFPHVIIDDFLPEAVAANILAAFPDKRSLEWQQFQNAREKKLANNNDALMAPFIRHILYQFNSAAACEFIEKLTGIDGIIPDPYFWGGGQHQIEPGGYLKVHADFNRHKKLRLDRRINLLLYLNRDWEEDYGGHLELWDAEMTHCVQKILPVFNRCVVFSTTSNSYHGHPEPLRCPAGRTRKSLALYYYTQGRPEDEVAAPHSTLFQQRPGEGFSRENPGMSARTLLKKLVPPILVDGFHYLAGNRRKHKVNEPPPPVR